MGCLSALHNCALYVIQVSLVNLVELATLDRWAQSGSLAIQDIQATLVQQEAVEQLDLRVRKVSVEILGGQEHVELLEQLDPLVH